MTTPLAPPTTVALAAVAVPVEIAKPIVTSNDMMQPDAAGQLMGEPVTALACVLRKIQSFAVGVTLALKNSVTGEQPVVAEATFGPVVTAPRPVVDETLTW